MLTLLKRGIFQYCYSIIVQGDTNATRQILQTDKAFSFTEKLKLMLAIFQPFSKALCVTHNKAILIVFRTCNKSISYISARLHMNAQENGIWIKKWCNRCTTFHMRIFQSDRNTILFYLKI